MIVTTKMKELFVMRFIPLLFALMLLFGCKPPKPGCIVSKKTFDAETVELTTTGICKYAIYFVLVPNYKSLQNHPKTPILEGSPKPITTQRILYAVKVKNAIIVRIPQMRKAERKQLFTAMGKIDAISGPRIVVTPPS